MIQLLNALIAIIGGVIGIMALFWGANFLVERLPAGWEQRLKPYVFIGPALAVVSLFLVFPGIRTIILSFFGPDASEFVGFQNYTELIGEEEIRATLINNVLWLIVVPLFSVLFGLIVAVLADRLKPRWESVTKSLIFLPMAISFVGASTIWGFVYAFRSEGLGQIGILNAIITGLGFDPVAWLQTDTFRLNTFLLTVIMVWLQTGFAMVLLSAAIKNVPEDTIEAARIDGATEVQIFFRVVVPQILSTIFVVSTTILILVLKVFDIVYVLTAGNFQTDVIANRFINELFRFGNDGRASTLVVFLMIAVIPFMILNIRRFREEEAMR